MIDDLHLRGQIVIDLKARLCYSKSKACEREIAILEEFRLPKPLCNFTEGSFAIPGKGFDNNLDQTGNSFFVILLVSSNDDIFCRLLIKQIKIPFAYKYVVHSKYC